MSPEGGTRDTDHEYPPREWTVSAVADALTANPGDATSRSEPTVSTLPTYENRATWRALASERPTRSVVNAIREAADRAREEPMSAPSASEFLAYERSGDRADYEAVYFRVRRRLAVFALAECVEREGRYLDAILDYAWRLCEETTWLVPAHLPAAEQCDGLPRPFADDSHRVALFSARTALLLADLDHLLGDRLHPGLRARLREEVDRRVLTPFVNTIDEHWGRPPTGNWNAVCNAGAAVAALRIETDTDRLARIVTKAVHSVEHYLANFDADGCTPEGVAYWNFGFGHYLILASALDAHTDGERSLFSPPVVPEIARFPLRVELGPGKFVPFSDTPERVEYAPYAACRAGVALDVPGLARRGRDALAARDGVFRKHTEGLAELWRSLAWAHAGEHDSRSDSATSASGATTTFENPPPLRTFFPGHAWWMARADPTNTDGLVVATKGGHNGEPHNHNDCGSVVVHTRGESLLADLGAPTYDRDYFGPDRYEYLTTRSLGHAVPHVDGHEQRVGTEFSARVLDRREDDECDALTLALEECYPDAAGLDALGRTVELDRSTGVTDDANTEAARVTIRDEASFIDRARPWDSVLVSYHPIELIEHDDSEGFVVTGDRGRASIEVSAPEGATRGVEHLQGAVATSSQDAFGDARDVWRARVSVPAAERSAVEFRVSPLPPLEN